MKIKILMITCDRADYTRLSLGRLCSTIPDFARVVIWDNSSGEETLDVVRGFESHPAVEKVVYNPKNDRLWGPTNWFLDYSKGADFVSKVDDDCLMPENWCDVLVRAHADIPRAGVLGCWRFPPEDFVPEKAEKKIFAYGPHRIMRNCWVEGSGYLMKREVADRLGPLRPGESFTTYCIRAAAAGYINGWYYPFLYQEHMDDPRAEHTGIGTDEDFKRRAPLSARNFGVGSKDAWLERLRLSARRLQEYSIDPFNYIGLRARALRKICSLLGKEYFPRFKP